PSRTTIAANSSAHATTLNNADRPPPPDTPFRRSAITYPSSASTKSLARPPTTAPNVPRRHKAVSPTLAEPPASRPLQLDLSGQTKQPTNTRPFRPGSHDVAARDTAVSRIRVRPSVFVL